MGFLGWFGFGWLYGRVFGRRRAARPSASPPRPTRSIDQSAIAANRAAYLAGRPERRPVRGT